jgi:hypothetical protein
MPVLIGVFDPRIDRTSPPVPAHTWWLGGNLGGNSSRSENELLER